MLHTVYVNATPIRWHRTVNARSEKNIDERRLMVDARPSRKNGLVLSNGEKLEELTVQMQIFDLEPSMLAGPRELPLLGRVEGPHLPTGGIGWLQHLSNYECLAGWFCVGPKNFEELWKEAAQPQQDTTFQIGVGPVDSHGYDEWKWDMEKTNILFVMSASFHIITNIENRI